MQGDEPITSEVDAHLLGSRLWLRIDAPGDLAVGKIDAHEFVLEVAILRTTRNEAKDLVIGAGRTMRLLVTKRPFHLGQTIVQGRNSARRLHQYRVTHMDQLVRIFGCLPTKSCLARFCVECQDVTIVDDIHVLA